MKSFACLVALAATTLATDAAADARADVFASFEKAAAQKSYRATSVTDTGGQLVESRIDVETPGSFHLKNADMEVVALPGATWMNQGGQWMKLPVDMSGMMKNVTLTAMRDGAKLVKDVEQLADATIAGCESSVYSYRSEGKVMGVDTRAKVEVAVCDATGLPVRIVSEDLGGNGTTTVVYDYTADVEIKAPQ